MANQTYDKLLDRLADVVLAGIGPHRDGTIWRDTARQQMKPYLDAIWPEIETIRQEGFIEGYAQGLANPLGPMDDHGRPI